MTLPTNGITPEIIRDAMPPYHLDQDLLTATFACIAPPPPDATTTQRHARITRLISEVAALRPADAAQARIATQILIIREFADSLIAGAQTEHLQINQLCRVARSNADLQRSANALERTLARHQQKPVPFSGTVIHDEVDIAALDATWTHHAPAPHQAHPTAARPRPAPSPATTPPPTHSPTNPPAPPPQPARPPAPPPTPPSATPPTERPAPHTRPAGTSPDWVIEQLDQGPGWAREVLRRRTAADTKPATRSLANAR